MRTSRWLGLVSLAAIILVLPLRGYPLDLEVKLNTASDDAALLVDYAFSEQVELVAFETTPHGFVASDWVIGDAKAHLDLSVLRVEFEKPTSTLTLSVSRPNDEFYSGFYTPFLNFSDGGKAIFVGHYLPNRVKIGGSWVDFKDIALTVSINAESPSRLWYAGLSRVDALEVTPDEARQYAYIGDAVEGTSESEVDMVLDPAIPAWIKRTYEEAIPQFHEFYTEQMSAELGFKPLVLVSFNGGDAEPRFDGGVVNQQLLINFVGEGWEGSSEGNRLSVLSLLAHEMAHLWNARRWSAKGPGSEWLSEGGAEFMANNALVTLGYQSPEAYEEHQSLQVKRCAETLKVEPLNQFSNRQNYYVCGEALFNLSSKMVKQDDKFWVLRKLMQHSHEPSYTEQDFLDVLQGAGVSARTLKDLNKLTEAETAHEAFIRLIGE